MPCLPSAFRPGWTARDAGPGCAMGGNSTAGGCSGGRRGRRREGGRNLMMASSGAPAGISVADLAVAIADAAGRKFHLRDCRAALD